jgi:DHA2 family multidrug resistance protein-like MFS transporter
VVAPHRLGAAIGWNALAVALSSAAGPVIGAALLAVAHWPWLFAVHLPLGLGVLLAVRALPQAKGTGRPLDLASLLLNAGVFAALVSAASCVPGRPGLAAVLLAGSVVQLWLLVRRERHKTAPMVPLDLLAARPFRRAVSASVLCFAGQTAGMVALPFFLQHGFGVGHLALGLYLMAWPLTVACMAPVAGWLADRASSARLCVAGGLCMGVGLGVAALVPPKGSALVLVPLLMLCGVGFSLFNVANNRAMFLSTPLTRSGATGGIQGTARLLGQTAGGVVMGGMFAVFSNDAALPSGLGIGALLALFAAVCSGLQGRRTC